MEKSRPEDMWQCQMTNCGYIYDPARGEMSLLRRQQKNVPTAGRAGFGGGPAG